MSTEHPTVEQLFIREASKHLTIKQLAVWELHNFDKLTQDEIAKKLNKSRSTVQVQLRQCERAITKWCKEHQFVYEMLKAEENIEENEENLNGKWQIEAWSHKTPIKTNKGFEENV